MHILKSILFTIEGHDPRGACVPLQGIPIFSRQYVWCSMTTTNVCSTSSTNPTVNTLCPRKPIPKRYRLGFDKSEMIWKYQVWKLRMVNRGVRAIDSPAKTLQFSESDNALKLVIPSGTPTIKRWVAIWIANPNILLKREVVDHFLPKNVDRQYLHQRNEIAPPISSNLKPAATA